MIPKNNFSLHHDRVKTLEDIISREKVVGLHENVDVLDYDNEYANLILKHNLSYETVVSSSVVQTIDKKTTPNGDRKSTQTTSLFQKY